ncbi:inactive peptidyl-prolyl cis-trans isomerase FKBP6 isoform X2 [Corvus kubaryi]|uniref:inactive peptidyl-prolyl cis-trans isomerase FKBP6 isoform X2 n=1 Tax=Corvus moneduloides TaxID=1196302 RepID=UPI00136424A8|nr:inactive peptidyl-prolyl cis-trans isomerase FKBP6 isoform X2 [Corvus moneduloides]XP_041881766.1 inactive peptidyl-prolyl cis-trans isomerase FKBP6 isoform X2 [Corvus kubaryi]
MAGVEDIVAGWWDPDLDPASTPTWALALTPAPAPIWALTPASTPSLSVASASLQPLQDLTSDGGVRKEQLRPGTGQPVPPSASVAVKYSGYLGNWNNLFCSNESSKYPRLMKLGKDITLWGLEIGLLSMTKGETALFVLRPEYAYGQRGCPPSIPPNTTVLFKVELLDFIDSEECDAFFELTYALSILGRSSSSKAEQSQINASKLLLFLNLSLTYLKMERADRALKYGELALEMDQGNAKALFRCGQACLYLREYRKSHDFLTRAQCIQPFNRDINNELKKLARYYREYMEMEKEVLPSI